MGDNADQLKDRLLGDLQMKCRNSSGHNLVEEQANIDKLNEIVCKIRESAENGTIPDQLKLELKQLNTAVEIKDKVYSNIIGSLNPHYPHEGIQALQRIANDNDFPSQWRRISSVCKSQAAGISRTFNFFSQEKLPNPQMDLLFRAISEFGENIRFDNRITTLQELLYVHQKRELSMWIKSQTERLKYYHSSNSILSYLFGESDTKLRAFETLDDHVVNSDITENAADILEKIKGISVEDENGHKVFVANAISKRRNHGESESFGNLIRMEKKIGNCNPNECLKEIGLNMVDIKPQNASII